jgi:single-strand DNA-binding protein
MAAVRQEEPVAHVNEVRLVGRLAAEAQLRQLPSGDGLLVFRLVVARDPGGARTAMPGPGIDTFGCVAWRGDVQRVVAAWSPGDVVEVSGALRRRFWRGPGGPASRCEVEVRRARRMRRAPS